MSKDKETILFDNIEWGNVTLPGLSDEELMTTNWNRKRTQADKEKIRELLNSDYYKKKHAKGIKNSKAFQQNLKNASKRNKKIAKDPEWQKAQREGAIKKYASDPEYNKKRSASLRKTLGRKIITPFGNFESPADFHDKKIVKCEFCDCNRMMPHLYYYADKGPGKPTFETVFVTPYGVYPAGTTTAFGSYKKRAFEDAVKNNCYTNPLNNKNPEDWVVRILRSHNDNFYKEKRIRIEWYQETNFKIKND